MQTFGNLTVRSQNEQRAAERAAWAAAGVQPRVCIKCSWESDPREASCPKCGVIFAKALPRTTTPPVFTAPVRAEDEFVPLAPEARDDAPYYLGELRVLSMLASLGTLALVAALRPSSGVDALDVVFVLHFAALLTWIGARAFEWGVKHGFIGVIVLFFVTGWIWPLMAKPIAWIARVSSMALPRATSWVPMAVLAVLSLAVAALR
jgi:hypothetical protein